MSTSKHIDKICAVAVVFALLLTLVFVNGQQLGITVATRTLGYETKLFNTQTVHTVDIVMDDWDSFLETCENEEYTVCAVSIDNEVYKNVAIRAKGNTSLSSVSQLGSQRYSFKLEFDHYDSSKSYYGLDKLSLNNLIQDDTMLKDYLTYQMMGAFGVDAPLCSFVYITVNGEDWGLYLAVEGVEDAFLQRNYGSNTSGDLYKPDSVSMGGGGPGNGKDFNMDDMAQGFGGQDAADIAQAIQDALPEDFDPSAWMAENGGTMPDSDTIKEFLQEAGLEDILPQMPDENGGDMQGGFGGGGDFGGGFGGDSAMGSDDAKLQYIDDDPDSYSTIFSSAKTTVTTADQTRLIAALKALSEGDVESCLDIDEVLRYFVVHNYVVNGDSYTGSMIHNYYLYEQDGLLSMIPWDYNLAFGGFQSSSATDTVNDPIDNPLSVTGDGSRPMVDWIFQNEEYTALYHEYFSEFLNTVDVQGIIEQAATIIAPYVEKDPTKFCTYEEFEQAVATLKEFCALRSESITGQLDGTIPSTSSGQRTNSAALVDASSITISDMGSMNNTMGGMGSMDKGSMDKGGMGGGMAMGSGSMGQFGGGSFGGEQPSDTSQAQPPSNEQLSADSGNTDGSVPSSMPTQGEMPAGEASTPPSGDSAPQMPQNSNNPDGATMQPGSDEQPNANGQPTMDSQPGAGTQPDTKPDAQPDANGQPVDGMAQPTQSAEGDDSSAQQPTEFDKQPSDTSEQPSQNGDDRRRPDGAEMQLGGAQQGGNKTILLLAASLGALLIGLLFACFFKRRR